MPETSVMQKGRRYAMGSTVYECVGVVDDAALLICHGLDKPICYSLDDCTKFIRLGLMTVL